MSLSHKCFDKPLHRANQLREVSRTDLSLNVFSVRLPSLPKSRSPVRPLQYLANS